MRTSQIRAVLASHKHFHNFKIIAVCASNELPRVSLQHLRPCIFVVNTDPNTKPGSHWVAIFLPSNTVSKQQKQMGKPRSFFFDPLGKHPSHYNSHLTQFLELNSPSGMPYVANKTKIQPHQSDSCGYFSCYFVLKIMDGKFGWRKIRKDMKAVGEKNIIRYVMQIMYCKTNTHTHTPHDADIVRNLCVLLI